MIGLVLLQIFKNDSFVETFSKLPGEMDNLGGNMITFSNLLEDGLFI